MNFELNSIMAKNQKILAKDMKIPRLKGFEFNISKEKRKRIPARRRQEVYEKYKNTCAFKGCSEKKILDVHHKNMKATDNRLANLELLCPTHHRRRHQEKFRKVVGRNVFTGEVKKKLVKKKPKIKKKITKKRPRTKRKSKVSDPFEIEMPKLDLGI